MIRRIIKKILPRPVIDFFIYHLYYKIYRRGYFAQSNLDKKLKKYIDYKNGFFVELGANDGFTASNTLYFERKKNWRGILIEPSPNLFLSCCFYRDKPGNHIFCNACVPFEYKDEYVEIQYAYLMSISSSLKSDLKNKKDFIDQARKGFNKYEKSLSFGAKARTLSSILDSTDAPTVIDLLSLDVEGAELEVLKGINFFKYSFKYILVESRDINRLKSFLYTNGYHLIDKLSHHDYLFGMQE